MTTRLLVLIIVMMMIGCSSPQATDAKEFASLWEQSANDSASSWWYYGEDEDNYHLSLRYPGSKADYWVSKESVELRGIIPMTLESKKKPVNVKNKNIVFIQDNLSQ